MTTAAVIGCGDVSVVHLQAIANLDGIDLVGVCDADADRAAAEARRYGVPSFTDHRELLDAVRPEVVHVCTPHHQHAQIAIDCLDAGVGVLVEKPVAHTIAEADRLIAAARRHPDVKVGICLQNRYNATIRAARALLDSADLGAVRGGSATVLWHRDPAYYRARPWRGRACESGGGVLINQAIHTLDLMEWLLGDVVRVRGHIGRYALDGVVDVEDTAQVLLEHAGGAADPRRPDGQLCRRARRDRHRTAGYHCRPVVLGCLARTTHRRLLPNAARPGTVLDRAAGRGQITASGPPDLSTEQLTQERTDFDVDSIWLRRRDLA